MRRTLTTLALLLLFAAPAFSQWAWLNTGKTKDNYSNVNLLVLLHDEGPKISQRGGKLYVVRSVTLVAAELEADLVFEPTLTGEAYELRQQNQLILTKWKLLKPEKNRLRIAVGKFRVRD